MVRTVQVDSSVAGAEFPVHNCVVSVSVRLTAMRVIHIIWPFSYLLWVCTYEDRLALQQLNEYRDQLFQECRISLCCGIMLEAVAQLRRSVHPEFNI